MRKRKPSVLWLALVAHNLARKALQGLAHLADVVPALGILEEEVAPTPGSYENWVCCCVWLSGSATLSSGRVGTGAHS